MSIIHHIGDPDLSPIKTFDSGKDEPISSQRIPLEDVDESFDGDTIAFPRVDTHLFNSIDGITVLSNLNVLKFEEFESNTPSIFVFMIDFSDLVLQGGAFEWETMKIQINSETLELSFLSSSIVNTTNELFAIKEFLNRFVEDDNHRANLQAQAIEYLLNKKNIKEA